MNHHQLKSQIINKVCHNVCSFCDRPKANNVPNRPSKSIYCAMDTGSWMLSHWIFNLPKPWALVEKTNVQAVEVTRQPQQIPLARKNKPHTQTKEIPLNISTILVSPSVSVRCEPHAILRVFITPTACVDCNCADVMILSGCCCFWFLGSRRGWADSQKSWVET